MAELATMARPYANAVFGIARQDNDLERWSRMLRFLAVASADPQVKLLLDSPEVPDEQKGFRLAEVCGDELNDRARKLTQVLASNKRLDLVDEIREQFEVLRAAEEKVLDVEVGVAPGQSFQDQLQCLPVRALEVGQVALEGLLQLVHCIVHVPFDHGAETSPSGIQLAMNLFPPRRDQLHRDVGR